MPRCAGLNRKRRDDKAWAKCLREAARGDRYCQKHRDALDGAFLGLMSRSKSLNAIRKIFYEDAEARRRALGRELARERQARRAEKKRVAQKARSAVESTGGKESGCVEGPSAAAPAKSSGREKIAAPATLAAAGPEGG
jgi:hypothetical protein